MRIKNAQGSVCVGCVCVCVQLLFALIIASALCVAFSPFLFPESVWEIIKETQLDVLSGVCREPEREDNIAFIQENLRASERAICICLYLLIPL
jgi:hypothetical protein